VLDVACGFGHTLPLLDGRGIRDGDSSGLDRNFFELYVARRWIAPAAEYVCAAADGPLPLPNGIGSAARSARMRSITSFASATASPSSSARRARAERSFSPGSATAASSRGRATSSRPPATAGCSEARGGPVLSDRAILSRYLEGLAPDLSGPTVPPGAEEEKWLSLAASGDASLFRDHGRLGPWPHAAGVRRVHSLYREVGRGDGDGAVYALEMPSKWFAFENGECREYMPARFTLRAAARDALERGADHPELDELVRRAAVLGFPERHG
jgi:hypothetical protein